MKNITSRRLKIRFWGIMSLIFIFLPPILFFIGVVLWAAVSYNGVCAEIMDIASYDCTIWEFITRNTISPFALPLHLGICFGWVSFGLVSVLLLSLVLWGLKKTQD